MRKHIFLLFAFIAIFAGSPLNAQDTIPELHDHEHSRNEIGFGVSAAYEISHHEWAPSFHLHYFRTLSPHSRWALGGGIEYLKEDAKHFEIGIGARYEPIDHLHFTLIPGITITDKAHFSIHTEATYEIVHIGKFHFGPAVGYAWSKNHSHFSIGIHIALNL